MVTGYSSTSSVLVALRAVFSLLSRTYRRQTRYTANSTAYHAVTPPLPFKKYSVSTNAR